MKPDRSRTLSQARREFERQSFKHIFGFANGKVKCRETGKEYGIESLILVDHSRAEGQSELDEMGVVYALQANDGTRGTLVDALGVHANPELGAFLARIPTVVEVN